MPVHASQPCCVLFWALCRRNAQPSSAANDCTLPNGCHLTILRGLQRECLLAIADLAGMTRALCQACNFLMHLLPEGTAVTAVQYFSHCCIGTSRSLAQKQHLGECPADPEQVDSIDHAVCCGAVWGIPRRRCYANEQE